MRASPNLTTPEALICPAKCIKEILILQLTGLAESFQQLRPPVQDLTTLNVVSLMASSMPAGQAQLAAASVMALSAPAVQPSGTFPWQSPAAPPGAPAGPGWLP